VGEWGDDLQTTCSPRNGNPQGLWPSNSNGETTSKPPALIAMDNPVGGNDMKAYVLDKRELGPRLRRRIIRGGFSFKSSKLLHGICFGNPHYSLCLPLCERGVTRIRRDWLIPGWFRPT
jgi:hypothetical protein